MELLNYTGTRFKLKVTRKIRILDSTGIIRLFLEITPGPSIKSVGYETDNAIINTGRDAWTELTGAPCLWVLDMFPPSDHATVILPYAYHKDFPGSLTAD